MVFSDVSSEAPSWASGACASVTEALARATSFRALSGLWSTARVRYDEVELPAGFRVDVVDVGAARRRIASCAGEEPAIVIVPGLFASLHERLFVDIAAVAQRCGRAVMVIEDRIAQDTLALNSAALPTRAALVDELSCILVEHAGRADVLALSAGALAAAFVKREHVRRVLFWSAALRPAALLAHARGSFFVRRHFDAVRRRVYGAAARPPPSWEELMEALGGARLPPLSAAPLLFVHAADDPVAPAEDIRRVQSVLAPGQAACIVRHGGHLGFGAVAGVDLYLLPFLFAAPALARTPTG